MNANILYPLAEKALEGLTQHGAALGLTHVTAAVFGPVLQEAKACRLAFQQSRAGKAQAYVGLRDRRAAATRYLTRTRDYLSSYFGNTWSAAWTQIGFTNNSLALPTADTGLAQILENVKLYLTAHPEHEVPGGNFTAAEADEYRGALVGAVTAVSDCKRIGRQKRDARDAAEAALEKKYLRLRCELEAVLDALDPRWLEFIDRIPGDPRVPEAVEDLTASAEPDGVIELDWEDAARATRYRVLKQVLGTDAELVVAETVEASEARLTGLPAGATVKLQVVPVNGAGEGAPSEIIVMQAA